MTTRRLGASLMNALLWVGALLGLAGLLAALAVGFFGVVPLIFTSGSMSPEIPTGSLGIARTTDVTGLAIGDVVSVDTSAGDRVTHRIVAMGTGEEGVSLTLKGDANATPDREQYDVTSADRLIFAVPYAGRVVAAVATPLGMFIGGALMTLLLVWAFRRGRGPGSGEPGDREAGRSRRRKAAGESRLALATAGAVAPLLAMGVMSSLTLAAFSDGGTVTTSGFVAHRVAQPASAECGTNLLSVTVTTPATDPRYTYWARAYNQAGAQISVEKQMTGTGTSRSATFNGLLSTDFPGIALELNTTYYMRVYARIGSTTWESADYRSYPFSKTKLGVVDVFQCGTANPAPIVAFTKPLQGDQGTTSGKSLQDQVIAACENGTYGSSYVTACGTTADDGSITTVQYILQRTGSTLGVRCWNGGLSWVTDCSFRTASTNAAKTRWSVPRGTAITYPYLSDGAFTLTIRATDNSGNVSESSIKFAVSY